MKLYIKSNKQEVKATRERRDELKPWGENEWQATIPVTVDIDAKDEDDAYSRLEQFRTYMHGKGEWPEGCYVEED